jgi:hypothetical protein
VLRWSGNQASVSIDHMANSTQLPYSKELLANFAQTSISS